MFLNSSLEISLIFRCKTTVCYVLTLKPESGMVSGPVYAITPFNIIPTNMNAIPKYKQFLAFLWIIFS